MVSSEKINNQHFQGSGEDIRQNILQFKQNNSPIIENVSLSFNGGDSFSIQSDKFFRSGLSPIIDYERAEVSILFINTEDGRRIARYKINIISTE